ncbi:hypothetical protein [Planctomycetes bacterium TBK1r]|uniref:Uncharacterized protein n=1 Tax=Stieleria magnilauensis TaxID=2527963 RepID=A0ABX5XY06_9BACT|nr:hypothetical protein TBK1r_59400 [Planctomycetes bacterium TBK1r]QDV86991.1 hypothetical protein TBK1r_60180 [Planctomycetes bacterium TBK1r]
MAYTYTPHELRTGRQMSFAGKGDSVSITWTTEYRVAVEASGGDSLADVDPYNVITASGLPTVNSSIYYFGGQVIPFVICRNKTATMDPKHLGEWKVKCSYKTFTGNQTEAENAPMAPPAAITNLGTAEQPSLGEIEKVLYEDKTPTTPQKVTLPSGAWFAEPVMERIPVLTIKLTQYESSITYQQMLDRKFKVNDDTYRTKAAGTWLIEDVEASTVSVQLSGGATTAALVTYTLVHSPLDEGWKKSLALIDNKVNTGTAMAPVWEPYVDDSKPPIRSLVFVDDDGIKKGSQVSPDYRDFIVYDETDFSAFLQA